MRLQCISIVFLGAICAHAGHATTCMVVGEKTARIQSGDGEKNPFFLARSCEALRLISGKAMATWVAADGKPNFVPIGLNGPERLPTSGSEDQSGNVVWAELTSSRETKRSALMRSANKNRPARIYIPVDGLHLPAITGEGLRVFAVEGGSRKQVFESSKMGAARLTRDIVRPGATYILEWSEAGKLEKWQWTTLGAQLQTEIDAHYQEVRANLSDETQRQIVSAMLFEQLNLPVNRDFALVVGR